MTVVAEGDPAHEASTSDDVGAQGDARSRDANLPRPRKVLHVRADRPESPPPLGGTVEAPEHAPVRPLPTIPRPVKLVALGLLIFGLADAAIWIGGEVGWRRGMALMSSVVLLLGILQLRYAKPSAEFIELARRDQREQGRTEMSPTQIYRLQIAFRLFVGTSLTLVGLAGLIVAIWGP
jgi:hypothetical protein